MSNLIPFASRALGQETVPTVNARDLYTFLGVKTEFSHWITRRIQTYGFVQDVDFTDVKSGDGAIKTIEYFVSLAMAKELSMVERTKKGKEARQYFLDCERQVQSPAVPKLHDPALQALMHIMLDLDTTKHQLALVASTAQQADTKAQQALDTQQFFTIAEYVFLNDLKRQMPDTIQQEYGLFLSDYCVRKGQPYRTQGVGWKRWQTENSYHVGTITTTLPGWLTRRFAQTELHAIPRRANDRRNP